MALSDYAHWNEDALAIWWQEEGRHDNGDPPDFDDYPEPTGAELDHQDAYDEGYSDGENGSPNDPSNFEKKSLREAYEEGYRDGSYVPETEVETL
jgi:hypothetical protein